MQIFITCVLFAAGVILIVKGGDIFVDASSNIAKILKIPTFVIGATIVSLATTLPEMIVSVMAAAKGSNEMAIGNAVGSVTANIALIMAIAIIFMPIVAKRKKYATQIILLIAASTVLLVTSLTGSFSVWGSVVLVLIFALFMIQNIRSAKSEINNNENSNDTPQDSNIGKNIFLFILGAAAIVIGSRLMIDNGEKIAIWLGVDQRIIAVTLVAVGTSLPELVTTITAIAKKESALSAGNIIGANIIDISLILPLCSLISQKPIPVSKMSLQLDMPVCLILTLIATVPILFKQKTYKAQGFILLTLYITYIAITIF